MNNYIVREAFIDGVAKRYCATCKEHGCDLDGDWCRDCVITCVLKWCEMLPPPTWSRCGTGGGKSATGLTWTSMGSVQEEPLRQDCGAASALVFSKRSCFGNETGAPTAAQKWKVVQTDDAVQR